MGMQKGLILIVIGLIGIFPLSSLAAPPKKVMQLQVLLASQHDCLPTLHDFVSNGMQPGKWESGDGGKWIYRVSVHDKFTRKTSKVSFLFEEFRDGDRHAIMLSKILSNGKYADGRQILNFTETIANSLQSQQICLAQQAAVKDLLEKDREAKARQEREEKTLRIKQAAKERERLDVLAKVQKETDARDKILGEYTLFNARLNTMKKITLTKNVDGTLLNISTFIQGKQVCKITENSPKIFAGSSEHIGYMFYTQFDDNANDCHVRVEFEGGMNGKRAQMMYKGECETYCDMSALPDGKEVFVKDIFPTGDNKYFLDQAFEQQKEEQRENERQDTWK